MNQQNLSRLSSIIFGALILCFLIGFYALAAWIEPTESPPGGNAYLPLNVSLNPQIKAGALILGDSLTATALYDPDGTGEYFIDPEGSVADYSAILSGKVVIGATTTNYKLEVVGDINIDGPLAVAGDVGTAGQFLESQGNLSAPTWVEAPKSSSSLGVWESKTIGTTYQADTDGFVTAWFYRHAEGKTPRVSHVGIYGYTDLNNPPTTMRTRNTSNYYGGTAGTLQVGITFPVRKGDNYRVTAGYSGGQSSYSAMYWIPLN